MSSLLLIVNHWFVSCEGDILHKMTVDVFPGGREFFISATLPLSMTEFRNNFFEKDYFLRSCIRGYLNIAVPTLAKNCRFVSKIVTTFFIACRFTAKSQREGGFMSLYLATTVYVGFV